MWLKIAILIVFAGLVISLFSGLVFLLKDQGHTRRTLHSLGLRVTLAAILMVLVIFGLATGRLESQAPWTVDRSQQQGAP